MFRQSEVGDFIMILCFSGTGNSRYIAKKIAAELEDGIVDVNAKIKAADYSPVKTGENVIVVLRLMRGVFPELCRIGFQK